ncbi:TetR/AcrR family transcriptional regulator [Luteimicrobium subarcticum]|uniref:TetR family transcriptional regulator n=1 Tax=Luteimicrobium subarcticum TaxID=620910 RepID=A0A2M8WSZ4_9MICO|nr:TetR/AcrR family transcriptional regulator [Luteimicrobium subarcticum]PJI94043.1 TetR family transcriptional regulator [Luteimicrobium subarcticum]
MTDERRTRLSPDERRAQLVAIGVAALADRSLDELTIDVISQQAGVSRGLLFYYFGSKQGFHREVVRAARDGLLRATEPVLELSPLERLHDTLSNLVAFVREHEDTFFSLVRGAASGDRQVREVVEQARALQCERVEIVCRELGVPDTALLRVGLRSWVAFAEQALVDGVLGGRMSPDEAVDFLERSLVAVVVTVDPEQGARLGDALRSAVVESPAQTPDAGLVPGLA